MTRVRYAQVGLGSRSEMFSEAVVERFRDRCELVALCDLNVGRLQQRADWAHSRGATPQVYLDTEFDRLLAETRPEVVIVTTKDADHDEYICRALEAGCDVITEKPLTIDEHKLQRILDTQKRTGRRVTVTFNYRYSLPRTQIKDLLLSGVIGRVISVDFHWLLDTQHGADYYRRWHRRKENSGGLMVHKATHHFDLINWWLSTVPHKVYASGGRQFYRPETAERYGLHNRGERCLGCPAAERCPFFLDLRAYPKLARMYLANEQYDSYYRDGCVWSEDINIEDTMQLVVDYRNGVRMSYSLHSFMPWEGYSVTINGSHGRLEHICQERVYISGDGSTPGELATEKTRIHIFPHFKPGYEVEVWASEGGHGGGDPIMLQNIFGAETLDDPYQRHADHRGGAWSILTGIAANHSMATGQPVLVDNLIHSLDDR